MALIAMEGGAKKRWNSTDPALFGGAQRDAAAALWRRFAQDETIDNRINKQDEHGSWREGR